MEQPRADLGLDPPHASRRQYYGRTIDSSALNNHPCNKAITHLISAICLREATPSANRKLNLAALSG